jgi:hypothetical protein
MSETDNQGVTNPTTSPVESNLVPKERLDELIAQRNLMVQQNQVLQDILRKAVPNQQPSAPVQEPEYLVRLKEENPAAYQALKHQEIQVKRSNATMFQLMEDNDRRALVDEFGDEGKKYLQRVEDKLQELRSQGIHAYNRGQIFYHLKGQESVQALKSPKPAPQAAAPVQNNLPSQDPSSASTIVSGSAAPVTRAATIEELEARYGDVPL